MKNIAWRSVLRRLGWLLLAAPALWQLCLLSYAVFARFMYPYDLEWMEGGILHHATRISRGEGIYVAPSIDFIPFLYTPLYPGVVAIAAVFFGMSYQVGRAISIMSLVGICLVAIASLAGPAERADRERRAVSWLGAVSALGLFAAVYPWVEGWYDLVRADTFFLFMITAGIHAVARWAKEPGARGHFLIAAAAAILSLSFFVKQTGSIYVLGGGALLLGLSWRKLPTFAGVAAAIGLGGTALMQKASAGWFWTYTFEIHQNHDFGWHRFWQSFGHILWHFPVMTLLAFAGFAAAVACLIVRRTLPVVARPALLWTPVFALSTLVGAIGWGTEFAHFNAFMPAMLHGALAGGAGLASLLACSSELLGVHRHREWISNGLALGAAAALALTLLAARWNPSVLIPTDADRAAGDALVKRIASIKGEVWVPSHPWYAHLAGKRMYAHRMGLKDVTVRKPRPIAGFEQAIQEKRFAALVLDGATDIQADYPWIPSSYHAEALLPRDERVATRSGARKYPESIWLPTPSAKAAPPSGARILFDFETGFTEWQKEGTAWGNSFEARPLEGQGVVYGARGRYATSYHGKDAASGILRSTGFIIDGDRITLRVGGGNDASKLRAELWVGGRMVRTATPTDDSEEFEEISWSVTEWRGQLGQLILVDESTDSWGHLNVDNVLLWER